jgi:hypothetical protein
MAAKILATLAATTITESYDNILPQIMAAQVTDLLGTEIPPSLVDVATADESHWRSIQRTQSDERRI